MDLKDVKIPYEILIRFGLDGLPVGAHCQYLRRVVLDGEVLKEDVGPAEPIDLEGFPTSAVMTDALRDALAQIAVLSARANELADQVSAASGAVETANERIALLERENEALIAEGAGLRAELSEPHDANVSMLQAAALAFSPNEVLPAEVEAEVMSRVYRAMEMDRVKKRIVDLNEMVSRAAQIAATAETPNNAGEPT